jgi:hypothetical protein
MGWGRNTEEMMERDEGTKWVNVWGYGSEKVFNLKEREEEGNNVGLTRDEEGV